jgi:hypothetical protein
MLYVNEFSAIATRPYALADYARTRMPNPPSAETLAVSSQSTALPPIHLTVSFHRARLVTVVHF